MFEITSIRIHTRYYDAGKSRTNRKEADAIVAEVVARLSDPEQSRHSIGIVTFSQAQQVLVEDLLEEARSRHPGIDKFFSSEANEPVFVKNLENVQGDERDVIFFSICYGPDINGKVAMRFGPLNAEGGERRLNVAITRARRELTVFTTLMAEHIDSSRVKGRGPRDLKAFLDFADRGFVAIQESAKVHAGADFDSPFEKEVHDALVDRGWEVHLQVGCSGYRIDLAVVHPDRPGRYLLGIECDGANYHSAKTARDRDRLREGVLRALGWDIFRIWSTDWWTDRNEVLAKLDARLESAMSAKSPEESNRPATSNLPAEPAFTDSPELVTPETKNPFPETHCRIDVEPLMAQEPPRTDAIPTETYQPYVNACVKGTQDMFYDSASTTAIREMIGDVVTREGPICEALLARRVASAWGFSRIRASARVRLTDAGLPDSVRLHEVDGETYYWPADLSPEDYSKFRVPGTSPDSKRSIDEIPPQEIGNAARHVLQQNISLPEEDLARETIRLFGFRKLSGSMRMAVDGAVAQLIERDVARRVGENIVIGQ